MYCTGTVPRRARREYAPSLWGNVSPFRRLPRISWRNNRLVINSAVKEALADHPVSADFCGSVNDRAAELLNEAAQRVEENQDCHVITFW